MNDEDTPRTAADWMRSGALHYRAGRLQEAEAATREAVRLDPHAMGAWANLGAILRAQRRALDALGVLDQALAIAPDAAVVLVNRANVLNELQRFAEALEDADRAIAANRDDAFAYIARGNALVGLRRSADAIGAFWACLRLTPENANARFNLATALVVAGDREGALEVYREGVAAYPDVARMHAEQGHLLFGLKRWAEAVASYDLAYSLDPNLRHLAGQRLHAKMRACDWRDFDALTGDLGRRIDEGASVAAPFTIIAAPLSAAQQLHCARVYATEAFTALPRPPGPAPGPRIRIGYFSADLHEHATAYLMAEVLELHDRAAFEVTAFSFGPPSQAPIRRRVAAACEHFVEVAHLSAPEIAALARERRIDIAVDLKGYTRDSRPRIFMAGAAPVQVSYLGYPMTMGAPFIDYLIADRTLIGPEDLGFYSEKVAWLPGCYQPNDRKRPAVEGAGARADQGLPEGAFVFASFNGSYKITPQVFAVWMDLLDAIPGSVLWLLQDDLTASGNLKAAAAAAGIDPGRLVFAPYRPQAEHMARIGHADLFLDSLPCCAHTTASDALWAGLPLITCRGETFAGRVAASLLTAAGLPDLIVENLTDYRDLALDLARDPRRLEALRLRVASAKSSPLFDTPAYVRGLEDLYRRMHARRLAGLPPDHLAPG